MNLTGKWFRGFAAVAMASSLAACSDILDVENKNNPETARVLATAGDVESLIRASFTQAKRPLLAGNSINMQLGTVAFANSAFAANFGMIERSQFPRLAINNIVSDQFHSATYDVWVGQYAAIRSASDGLIKLNEAGFTLGSAAANARGKAFGKFVLGFAHANLAVTYDQASIHDETVPFTEVVALTPYADVMAAALGYFDEAIALSQTASSFPEDWLGVAMTTARFRQVASSLKARYRTQVARTPAERQAVDWAAVIAESDAGITTDWEVVDDDNQGSWDFWMHDYMSFKGAWHQIPYVISGMADTSGAYQGWMATPINNRLPIFLFTPDQRWPQGSTFAAQQASPGLYIRAKTNSSGEAGWGRAERGTWRWSHYVDDRYAEYYDANNVGVALPVLTVTEIRLYKAEALIRLNRQAEALPLINLTRVGNGGLPPATLLGAPGVNSCVPKLPDGTCGNLLETLKHEKRIEEFMTVYGAWYFDSRGWGDLPVGTYLHYPVPARELEVRQLPLYTFGGAGNPGSAPTGTYGY